MEVGQKKVVNILKKLDPSQKYLNDIKETEDISEFVDDVEVDIGLKCDVSKKSPDEVDNIIQYILLDRLLEYYSQRLYYWSKKYAARRNTKFLEYLSIINGLVAKYDRLWEGIKDLLDSDSDDEMNNDTDLDDSDSDDYYDSGSDFSSDEFDSEGSIEFASSDDTEEEGVTDDEEGSDDPDVPDEVSESVGIESWVKNYEVCEGFTEISTMLEEEYVRFSRAKTPLEPHTSNIKKYITITDKLSELSKQKNTKELTTELKKNTYNLEDLNKCFVTASTNKRVKDRIEKYKNISRMLLTWIFYNLKMDLPLSKDYYNSV